MLIVKTAKFKAVVTLCLVLIICGGLADDSYAMSRKKKKKKPPVTLIEGKISSSKTSAGLNSLRYLFGPSGVGGAVVKLSDSVTGKDAAVVPTGSDGSYRISGSYSGLYDIKVSASGYNNTSQPEKIDLGASYRRDFTLEPAADSAIKSDITSPIGKIKINNGAEYTGTTKVTLNMVEVTDNRPLEEISMQFLNDGSSSWSLPEKYASTKQWDIPSGDTKKKVFAKFKDKAGNISLAVSDEIVLDTVAPKITAIAPKDASIYNEAEAVNISVTAKDTDVSPIEYQFSVDAVVKQAWSNKNSYNWSAQAGVHRIKIEVRDAGGTAGQEVEVCVYRQPVKGQ